MISFSSILPAIRKAETLGRQTPHSVWMAPAGQTFYVVPATSSPDPLLRLHWVGTFPNHR